MAEDYKRIGFSVDIKMEQKNILGLRAASGIV